MYNSALRVSLIVIGVLTLAGILLLGGFWIGQANAYSNGFVPGGMMGANWGDYVGAMPRGGMMGSGMMHGGTRNSGMMNEGMMGSGGMMGSCGMMGSGGMMGGGGMMDPQVVPADVEPLDPEAAEAAVAGYVDSLGIPGLAVGEVMVFDNHAYAQIVEEATGIGAMEVLVDPVTLKVYPEHGPNMMWNLKYGMMAGGGMMSSDMSGGCMMGTDPHGLDPADISPEMTVSPDTAVEAAQRFLDARMPGARADDHAVQFYGYFTLHILTDGEISGMLSVNGYSGKVFLHTWHGAFIEMTHPH